MNNLSKINEVIKASPAIQIQSKISLLQRRAWNVLLANAYNELVDKDIHRVSMVELAAKLGFGDGNQEYLKEMLKSLVDCTVEWNVLGKDNKEEWGAASLLAEVRINDGICTYAYAPYLRAKLHNPRIYTKLKSYGCKTGSPVNTLSFYGSYVSITLILRGIKARPRSFHLKPTGS